MGQMLFIGGIMILYVTAGSLSIGSEDRFDWMSENLISSVTRGKEEMSCLPGIEFCICRFLCVPTCNSSK